MHGGVISRLGPGLLLAATSIGASHLVMAPQSGALFGVALLWVVPLSHLLKYPAFEFGPRYAAARGESLLAGYSRVPGPKNWAVWAFLFSTTAQGFGVLAGVVGITAAVLTSYVGVLSMPWWSGATVVTVLLLLALGGFSGLDVLNKAMMAVLTLATILAVCAQPPPPGAALGLVVPTLPEASLPLFAALLGWMPTGIDVSVWHSLWTVEKQKGHSGDTQGRLRLALGDMRFGYGLSVFVGIAFVLLGASHLSGRGHELLGPQFPTALAEAYAGALGTWMFHLFFVAAFFAMFSTSYTVLDGFSRSFSEALVILRPSLEPIKRRLFFGFAGVSGATAFVTLATVGNPVSVVLVVAVVSLCFAPVLYALNTYCVWKHVRSAELRPARPLLWLACLGAVLMAAAAMLFVWVKLR